MVSRRYRGIARQHETVKLKYFGLLGSMEVLGLLTWEERLYAEDHVDFNVDFHKLLSKVDDD